MAIIVKMKKGIVTMLLSVAAVSAVADNSNPMSMGDANAPMTGDANAPMTGNSTPMSKGDAWGRGVIETAPEGLVEVSAALSANASSGDFAPYMIGSWNYGKTVSKNNVALDLRAIKRMDLSRRFSWGAGVELTTGYHSATAYERYNAETLTWGTHNVRDAAFRIQQLYGEVKFRGVRLTVGMKNHHSILVNDTLSSGDLVSGVNSRPIAQGQIGFVDYQPIPFTNGWAQIYGTLTYGRFTDTDWLKDQYNHYNAHINESTFYTYKNLYFRSNPTKPLMVSVGVQCAGQYGGTSYYYANGQVYKQVKNSSSLKSMWKMLFPSRGNGDGYYEGSQLGSWDFRARYRIKNGDELSAYFQWLWEDGSSMGRRNKTDGLWGIEYQRRGRHALKGIVIEYIDMRDQSGPIHWAPGDNPGTTMTGEATGGDDYYNNTTFNAHANYGMSIGSPFVLSPVYNLDGDPEYRHTRSNGFHLAANGSLSRVFDWTAKVSYQHARGRGRLAYFPAMSDTSASVAASWADDTRVKGLSVSAQVAFDAGSLRGDNFGALVTVKYTGLFNYKK
jgi:hypothetical protein